MSANKRKGTAWESALVGFFRGLGIEARRVAQEGHLDSGDIHGISPFVGQAKNYKSWEDAMRLGLDGANRQKVIAGEPFGVAFVKRIRKGVGGGYAVMSIDDFAALLVRLRRAESGAPPRGTAPASS